MSVASSGKNYVSGAQWAANGALSSWTMGNGLVENRMYNARFQTAQISAGNLLTLNYAYGDGSAHTGHDNGNVWAASVLRPGSTFNQYYSYDNMNRLLGTNEFTNTPAWALGNVYAGFGCPGSLSSGMTWCEGYSYDVFGNRGVQAASLGVGVATTAPTGFDSNNRNIGGAGGTGWIYDSTGNVLEDGAGDLFTWDAENRMVTGGGAAYGYDADGRRVTKQLDTVATTYVYDATGREALEFDTADGTTGTQYLTTDALGSTRLVTDQSGSVLECRDYLPFGEQLVAGRAAVSCMAGDLVRQQFTGKERDSETGLDYFGARYLSSAQGRWMSPDWSAKPVPIPYARLEDPQTMNLYGYLRNNPLLTWDPDGHDLDCSGGNASLPGCEAILKWFADRNIDPNKRAVKASVTSPGSEVTYSYGDGSTIRLVGTRNFRDNNAGNQTRNPASLGKDGAFEILPAAWDGINAVALNLQNHPDRTLLEQISIQTPPDDGKNPLLRGNDPVKYTDEVTAAAGVSANTRIKDLTPGQFSSVVRSIATQEGYFRETNRAIGGQR